MPDYVLNVVDDEQKQVEVWYRSRRKLRFQFKQRRSFTVFKRMVEVYPDFLSLHDLDDVLKDPNKAYSELKNTDGFISYVIQKKTNKNVVTAKINLDQLFADFNPADSNVFLKLHSLNARTSISEIDKTTIYKNFRGKCNITGIPLQYPRPKFNLFMKNSLTAAFDHRRPLFHGGEDRIENLQLVSELVNQEKRKMCVGCRNVRCEECALAYPEEQDTIQANMQSIRGLRSQIAQEPS